MIQTNQDIYRRFAQADVRSSKDREREEVKSQIDAYLATGKQINCVPPGASAEQDRAYGYSTIQQPKADLNRQNAAKRSKATRQQSSTVGGGEAAKIIGISPKHLREMSLRGEGPKCQALAGGQARFKYLITDLEEYKRESQAKPGVKSIADIARRHA